MADEVKRGPGRPPKQPDETRTQDEVLQDALNRREGGSATADPLTDGTLGGQVGQAKLQQQEEAERIDRERLAIDAYNAEKEREAQQQEEERQALAAALAAKGKKGERLVEVLLERKYAPENWPNEDGELVPQGEVKRHVAAGTTISLPKKEAERALRMKIATTTQNTFED